MDVADRQAFALANPVTNPADVLSPAYADVTELAGGNLLRSILAVDR